MDSHVKYLLLVSIKPGASHSTKTHSLVILKIPNDSALSLGELRAKLRRVRGVVTVDVNPVLENVTVRFDPSTFSVDQIRALLTSGKKRGKVAREKSPHSGGKP